MLKAGPVTEYFYTAASCTEDNDPDTCPTAERMIDRSDGFHHTAGMWPDDRKRPAVFDGASTRLLYLLQVSAQQRTNTPLQVKALLSKSCSRTEGFSASCSERLTDCKPLIKLINWSKEMISNLKWNLKVTCSCLSVKHSLSRSTCNINTQVKCKYLKTVLEYSRNVLCGFATRRPQINQTVI